MDARLQVYIPQVFRNFPGFILRDIKEWHTEKCIELHLQAKPHKRCLCCRCGGELGSYHDQYRMKVKHMRMMDWAVEVVFYRQQRHCPACFKVRSEKIEFLCEDSPHITKELAWWMNRLTEITSVLAVSRLESIDKMSCYRVDKYILKRLLQGYKIPKLTQIGGISSVFQTF